MTTPEPDLTAMLHRFESGDREAVNELLPLVYERIRQIAERQLSGERRDHTLQATALANEAFMRLIDQRSTAWQSRAHFFAVAARAIRRLLIDHARARGRLKRGGDLRRMPLESVLDVSQADRIDLIALEEALTALTVVDHEAAQVVEMRFYGGMTVTEIAQVIGHSTRTIERHWQYARAWLYRRLAEGGADAG